jgi:hypothetical protein
MTQPSRTQPDPHPNLDPYPDFDPFTEPDPYPDRTGIPYTDTASTTLLDELVNSLIILRGGATLDPGAQLSVLASLQAQTDQRIPNLVLIARLHHGYPWTTIASRLAITTDTARRRYSTYIHARSKRP